MVASCIMERPLQRVLPLWLCALAVAALQCGAIHFYITPGEKRCFEEDLPVASKVSLHLFPVRLLPLRTDSVCRACVFRRSPASHASRPGRGRWRSTCG